MKNNYDGYIQISELSWLKKPPHPSKIVQLNDKLTVKLIEIDNEKRRLNCSLKLLKQNPWDKINKKFSVGDIIDTEIVNKVDFGIFVKILDEIDGMVHVSDLSWSEEECIEILKSYKKKDKVSVKILEINMEKERISLGVKHLKSDPVQQFIDKHPIKSIVSGEIATIDEKGLTVNLDKNIMVL